MEDKDVLKYLGTDDDEVINSSAIGDYVFAKGGDDSHFETNFKIMFLSKIFSCQQELLNFRHANSFVEEKTVDLADI